MITIKGKKYIEYTRETMNTVPMIVYLAPEHLEAAKRIGGSVSKGIREALRFHKDLHYDWATSELVTGKTKDITTTSNYKRICISITPGSKKEALAISKASIVDGIRIALELSHLDPENKAGKNEVR